MTSSLFISLLLAGDGSITIVGQKDRRNRTSGSVHQVDEEELERFEEDDVHGSRAPEFRRPCRTAIDFVPRFAAREKSLRLRTILEKRHHLRATRTGYVVVWVSSQMEAVPQTAAPHHA